MAGIEVDRYYKPVGYYIKQGDARNYQVGKSEFVPASEIIHLFKQEFPDQVHGIPCLNASLDTLKQLDDYGVAELFAAKVGACLSLFYERNNSDPAGDFLDQQSTTDDGVFISELSPGQSSVVPKGYTVKSVSNNHPNSNFADFFKATLRRATSSMGISYNKAVGDYSDVNYSSLREARLDEAKFFKSWQLFLINNWKNIEFEMWLKSYIINGDSKLLKASDFDKYCRYYNFIGRSEQYFDISKEMTAIERKLKLGLSNPMQEIEALGLDAEEVLDGWVTWRNLLEQRGLNFNHSDEEQQEIVEEDPNSPEKTDEMHK